MIKLYTRLLISIIVAFSSLLVQAQQNKYWVGKAIYQNNFSSTSDLSEWRLTEDNGTGSWIATTTSSAILKMDNTAGGNSNKLINVTTGTTPRLLTLDKVNGNVQYQVLAMTGGQQSFYLQVQEYTAAGTYLGEQDLQVPQFSGGFYTLNMSTFDWDPATTKVRFSIAAENQSGQQGTIELNYFSYYNTNLLWSNNQNWSTTSGGVGGASLPTTTDNVYFDQNSISNAFIDVPVSIQSITLQSTFKAGLVQGGSHDFMISGNAYLGGGFLVGESADLYVNNVTVDGTQYTATSGTIHVSGSLIFVSGNFIPSTGTIEFGSSNPQNIPAVNYYNLILSGTGAKTAAASFSVAGNFTNNSNLNAGAYTVVFNGTGAIQKVSGTAITAFNNVLVKAPAVVTLTSAQQIKNTLTLMPGATFNTGNALTLVATSPTLTGSIGNLTGATLNGTVTVQKYIYSSMRIYRYLTSPVAGGRVSAWQATIPITGTFSNPSTGAGMNSTTPSMFVYTENTPGVKDEGYAAYPAAGSSTSAALTRGKGYAIFVRDNAGRPQVVSLTGNPYKGNISIPVTYTATTGGSGEDGWNLIGNPYPASIDWSLVDASDRVGIDNAIYYLDNNSASPVYRTFVNGVGVNCSNGVISSSQGFWVKANNFSPSLTLHETHKTVTTASFYRIAADKQILRIQLDSASTNEFMDETVISLQEDATMDFDSELDAYKLYDARFPAIGSYQSNASILAINALSAEVDTIALFTHITKAGTYRLSVSENSLPTNQEVSLWDTELNTKNVINNGFTYSYQVYAEQVSKPDRFKLVMTPAQTTEIDMGNVSNGGLAMYPNPVGGDKAISIKWAEVQNNPVAIRVFDMMGNTVLYKEHVAADGTIYKLQFPDTIENGIYNVFIQYNNTSISQKIIIK